MEELIVRIDNLINEIDNTSLVKDIKILNKKIKDDKKLQELLNEYHVSKNESIN